MIFVPDDVAVARSSPETRRRFLDRAVFGAESAHLSDTLTYGRALKSRNVLLKSHNPTPTYWIPMTRCCPPSGGG